MTSYQVHDYDRVVLVDPKTYLTIENCTKLVVGYDERQFKLNNKGHELINCRESYHRYGQNGKAIPWDEMPSERSVNGYVEAFVQLSSAIAYTLEKEKKTPLVYCKNGRSRSPCVVAAFFIIYRGLSLSEIEVWFKQTYPMQRPVTADMSSNFPNIDKFRGILSLLETSLANPQENIRGFSLAASVANCSEALGYPLTLATRPAAAANLENLDPLCFAPSIRHIFQRPPSHNSCRRMTRSAKRREHERIDKIAAVSKQKARVSLSPNLAARTDKRTEEHENEEVHETQPSDENTSNGKIDGARTDEAIEEHEDEAHDTQSSGENTTNEKVHGVRTDETKEEHEDEAEARDTQSLDENASDGQSDGVRTDEAIEEHEDEAHETLLLNGNASDGESLSGGPSELQSAALDLGMKAQTNPNMACITFDDHNNTFVLCTDQKLNESTTSIEFEDGENIVVLQGLDGYKYFVPDIVIDVSDLDPISMSEAELSEALVTMSARMAIPANQKILLVCEDAESFGKVASLYASLYLAFRNEDKLDAQQCIDSITQAFRQQCPSSFDEHYDIPQIQTYYSALESIQRAERHTLFETKTLEKIVEDVHANVLSSKKDSDLSRYHNHEDLLKWNQDGPGPGHMINDLIHERENICLPNSAFLSKGVGEILLDCPDWIPEIWPNRDYDNNGICGAASFSATAFAVGTGNIAACAFLLSEMGREHFFLDWTTPSKTTPLYHAAKCGDIALVSWMLNNGGDISLETGNNDGKTPLLAACKFGHLHVAKILILHGASVYPPCGISPFDALSLNLVEELRLWIKKLVDDDQDVCDSAMVKRLKHVHSAILERYLEEYHDDNDEDEVVDLSSFDHGDHEFLKDDPRDVDWDSPSDIKDFAIYEARKIARATLFEQIDPKMHMLCYYGTKKSDADEEAEVMDAEAPLVAIQTDNSGSINPSLSHNQADETARVDDKKRRKDDDGRAVSKKKRKVVSTLQTKTPRSKSSVAPRVSLSPGTSPTECDDEQG